VTKRSRYRRVLYWTIATVVSAVCLYAAFRGLDWDEFFRVIRSSNALILSLVGGISTSGYVVRALRWKRLAAGKKGGEAVPFGFAFFSVSIGYVINNFAPARLGDLAKVLATSQRARISKAYLLACGFSERVFDIVALQLLFFTSVILGGTGTTWIVQILTIFLVVLAVAAAVVIFFPRMGGLVQWLAKSIPWLSAHTRRVVSIHENLKQGLEVLGSARKASIILGLSLAAWLLDATSALVVWRALGVHLNLASVIVFLTAIGFAAVIPATPGSVGVFQLVGVVVLGPMGFSREQALGYMLLWQGMAYLVSILWGVPGLIVLRPRSLKETAELRAG
jgi:uncharacterized protein (TIRG00374 family)